MYLQAVLRWSPDGGKLLFHDVSGHSLKVIWMTTKEILDLGPASGGSWSPDSQKIAMIKREKDKVWIIVMNIERREVLSPQEYKPGRHKISWRGGQCVLETYTPVDPFESEPPMRPGTRVKQHTVVGRSPDEKKLLIGERVTPLRGMRYFMGFWDGKQITQRVALPVTMGDRGKLIWYPDCQRLLVVACQGSDLDLGAIKSHPMLAMFLVSIDEPSQKVNTQTVHLGQRGFISEMHLLDPRPHLYLYIIGGELWLGELRGVG